ncbi:MAG: hypothetical protein ACJASL_004906 [Paraglaciecola sp.]|jgi:hypothetical protein
MFKLSQGHHMKIRHLLITALALSLGSIIAAVNGRN